MEIIELWISQPDERTLERRDSLNNLLSEDPYLKENARVRLSTPTDPSLSDGSTIAVVELIFKIAVELGKASFALFKWWRDEGRTNNLSLCVRSRGHVTELTSEDLSDPDDKSLVRHRALAGVPDPRKAACILFGVSDYGILESVPAVRENIARLSSAFADPKIWGIPRERVHTIDPSQSPQEILASICNAVREASDITTLLVYFAGHGIYNQGRLRLALSRASGRADDDEHTISWEDFSNAVSRIDAQEKVVLLDCCYGGAALPTRSDLVLTEVVENARSDDLYLMVAAHWNEQASAPAGEACTAFTGEFIKVLREGVPSRTEFLSLNKVHEEVRKRLRSRAPDPKRWEPNDDTGNAPRFRNNGRSRWKRTLASFIPAIPRSVAKPELRRFTTVLAALVGLVVVGGVAYGAESLLSASSEPPLGGLDLSAYCSSLQPGAARGFLVSGDECYHKIDLSEACKFSYPGNSQVAARYLDPDSTPPDPNSAVCYIPGRSDDIGGISNMNGYCHTLTRVANVSATAADSRHRDTWICQVPINYDLACDTQYMQQQLEAVSEDGTWECYRN